VAPIKGYRDSMWYGDTGLTWIAPSPNINDVDAAVMYPGISLFEATNVSEGRGTTTPFRLVGASWLNDAAEIARAMNSRKLDGVKFDATRQAIRPGEKFGGMTIPMVRIDITDRNAVRSSIIAAALLREIYARHPKQFKWQKGNGIEELSGSRRLRAAVENGHLADLFDRWNTESASFRKQTAKLKLYR
jgi:beta-N-acetylhexosaminidase